MTCTFHCSGCNGHFSSLEAFDLHRQGRVCADPDDVVGETPRTTLVVKADDGYCGLGSGEAIDGAVIYQTQDARERPQRVHTGARAA